MTDTELQVVQAHGPVRSDLELSAYAKRHPCSCGEASIEGFKFRDWLMADGGHSVMRYEGECPRCGRPRSIRAVVVPDEPIHYRSFHLADTPLPSQVIGPHEFVATIEAYDRVTDPDTLPLAVWDEQTARSTEALIALNELTKFLPDGATEIPDDAYRGDGWPEARAIRPACYTRAWIEATRAQLDVQDARILATAPRMAALRGPPPPPPKPKPFTRASLEAHRLWNQKGGDRGQRLEVAEHDATGVRLAAERLEGLIADHVGLDRADLSMSTLDGAELTGCSFRDAGLGSTSLVGATIVHCAFDRANAPLLKLGDATVIGCSFAGAHLDRSTWYRAVVRDTDFRGAVFGNAAFDNAVFTDCDFRGADFSLVTANLLGTVFDVLFERCDLRGTRWAGRSLYRAQFHHGKFAGSSGPPTSVADAELLAPDLSDDGAGTTVVTRDDLCRYWQMDMAHVLAEDESIRAYWTKRWTDQGYPADDPELLERIRNPRGAREPRS